MTDDNVTQLPESGVTLNLDLETRKDQKAPFVVKVGDRNIRLDDPTEIHWRDLASVEMPADLLRVAMTTEDRNHLYDAELPTWKFNRLMEAYYTHYDLENEIAKAKRQASFRG